MLKSLSISNYALIDKMDIRLENGLTVITGETGAGKSVLLGAMALILGQRSDVSALLNKERKCVVEGVFDLKGYGLQHLFAENEVDYDEQTIVRREVLPTGKSRAFVNDMPVNIGFLKIIGDHLIDIHSQHQNLLLDDSGFQRTVIDSVANNGEIRKSYTGVYRQYKDLQVQLAEMIEDNNKQKDDLDYMQFQYEQLEQARLKEGEQQLLESSLEELTHAEDIKGALSDVVGLLLKEPTVVVESLRDSMRKLQRIEPYLADGSELLKRIETAYIDLKDLAEDLETRSEDIAYDPEAIQQAQERLDLIYSLQKKHHVDTVEELIALFEDLKQKIDKVNFFDEEVNVLKKKIAAMEAELEQLAYKITESRCGVFETVQRTIEGHLTHLGMPHARFIIQHEKADGFAEHGKDVIEFLFSGNKNGAPAPINKVASGGEMSRVMLSIKSLLSSAKGLPTIIFDEIDTGVSGEVADQMGVIMEKMGATMQVISITHLPQIAVKGKQHFRVFKTDNEHSTVSQIAQLKGEDRVVEIAKMLSGATLTDVALQNARTLLNN